MPATPPTVPFGSWPSPITAARLVEGADRPGEVRVDGTDVWWSEQRPGEGGRTELVRRSADGSRHDLLGADDGEPQWNVRTAVGEYGGGAWVVRGGVVVFANWTDQRLYRVDPGAVPVPITPPPEVARGLRWSEPTWLDDDWLVCVRESHERGDVGADDEAGDALVALPVDGSAADDSACQRVLVAGPDFLRSPATRGDRLAWLRWDHPRMPWDGTELVVADIVRDAEGAPVGLGPNVVVAGGPEESVVQPGFLIDGSLVCCSDRTGWWNPWLAPATALDAALAAAPSARSTDDRAGAAHGGLPLSPMVDGGAEEEIGGALWVGGLRWWAELPDGRLVVTCRTEGADHLALLADGGLTRLDTPFTEITQVVADPAGGVVVVAASPVEESAPHLVTLADADADADAAGRQTGTRTGTVSIERLVPARDLGIDPSWWSTPRHLTFDSAGGRRAHALLYPPGNPDVTPPPGERPPLLVLVHGGPTSSARWRLDLTRQFWTSRGFAVVDVDHGGSTGYGRPFRQLLRGRWGVVDVEDAVAAAEHLAAEGLVDGDRMAIRGGSAGGFTTLAALCFHDAFAAGASHYGVADLAALARETHKFERRYLDSMVGPWPEAAATYAERSPLHHTDGFDAPLILFHGSEDAVVPPAQTEVIVGALARRGVPHAYLVFEGEQHGFRRADTQIRALEAELWFYGRVFGFDPADAIAPVPGATGLDGS